MTFSLKRVNAIFQKDFKDFSRNMAVSVVIFLPLVVAFFTGRASTNTIAQHYMTINIAFTMIATYVQCCLIAEEKEKNTLRGLMLSPASILEILAGKSLLTFLVTMIIIFFSTELSGYNAQNTWIVAIAIILSSLFYIGLGTLLGLVAKSVMDASVIVLPVVGVFSLGSYLMLLTEKYPILKIAEFMPNIQLIGLAEKVETGAGFAEVFSNLGIISIWVVVVCLLTVSVFRKRMTD